MKVKVNEKTETKQPRLKVFQRAPRKQNIQERKIKENKKIQIYENKINRTPKQDVIKLEYQIKTETKNYRNQSVNSKV